jgi:hypothetical protein
MRFEAGIRAQVGVLAASRASVSDALGGLPPLKAGTVALVGIGGLSDVVTVGLTNNLASPLARAVDVVVPLGCARGIADGVFRNHQDDTKLQPT